LKGMIRLSFETHNDMKIIMNRNTILASVMILAFTLVAGSAQEAPVPMQSPSPAAAVDQITINVLGQVNKPARITLPKAGTLLDAIASVGGLTRYANPAKTMLIHKSSGGKPDSTKIDLRPILAGAARDIILKDGDTVVIGESTF